MSSLLVLPGCTKKLEEENRALKSEVASIRADKEAAVKKLSESQVETDALRIEAKSLRTRVAELESSIQRSLPAPTFDLTGEVFIATKGGATFKLSAVDVALVPRQKVDEWISAKITERDKKLVSLSPRIAAARDAYQKAEAAYYEAFEAKIKAEMVFPRNETQEAKLVEAKENMAIREELRRRRSADLEELLAEERPLYSGSYFFLDSPDAAQVVATNSDGRFRFTVDREQEWVLLASAQRLVGNSTEKYYWVVAVKPPRGSSVEVQLNHRNTTATLDSLLQTKD